MFPSFFIYKYQEIRKKKGEADLPHQSQKDMKENKRENYAIVQFAALIAAICALVSAALVFACSVTVFPVPSCDVIASTNIASEVGSVQALNVLNML